MAIRRMIQFAEVFSDKEIGISDTTIELDKYGNGCVQKTVWHCLRTAETFDEEVSPYFE
jgi:hypothetical protein